MYVCLRAPQKKRPNEVTRVGSFYPFKQRKNTFVKN